MSAICSLLWIGPAEGLARDSAPQAPSLDITWVRDADEALALSPSSVLDFDVVLLDCEIPALLPAVRQLGKQQRFPPLLVRLRRASGRNQDPGDEPNVSDLLAAGAADVFVVPSDAKGRRRARGAEELARRVRTIAATSPRHIGRFQPAREPQAELEFDPPAGSHPHAGDSLGGVAALSPSMRPVLALIERARHSLATVLLTGETGTGKEVVAKAIHAGGPRKKQPFIAVNCAAFPEALLESELFGHKKGAFTSAYRDKAGLFEAAHEGTLFLDEIGETSAPLQAKLLRVLQEREVRPVGASRSRRVNVRVIAATNRPLNSGPASDFFRRDLYYRLAVFPIAIPPLRRRVEDIVLLAEHFLTLHGRREQKEGCQLSTGAERLLLAHAWPGNVRELENEMQRALALVDAGEVIHAKTLSPSLSDALAPVEANVIQEDSLRDNLHRVEAWMIRRTLEQLGGRRAATARKLGITREGLYKKMKRLNID